MSAAAIPDAPRQALVLAATADLDFALGSCLAGFLAHNPGFQGEIHVLHDGLSPPAEAALRALAPRLRLRALSTADIATRLAASGAASPAQIAAALRQCPPFALAKFEMFDWLDHHDRLVWFDLDLLVRAPLAHLWRGPGALGWRPLPPGGLQRRAARLAALAPLLPAPEAGQPDHIPPFPNAGVLTLSAAPLRAAGVTAARLYALAAEILCRTGGRTLDEITLHLLARQAGLEVTPLDLADNHPVAQEGSDQARILHAIGPDKFWTATPLWQACPDWAQHQARWHALGGRAAPPPDRWAQVHPLAPAAALTQARNRAYWQQLWPDLAPLLPPGFWPELRPERSFLRLLRHPAAGQGAGWTAAGLVLELHRSAAEHRLQIRLAPPPAVATADVRGPAPAQGADLDAALQSLGLERHDGRRGTGYAHPIALPLADLPAALERIERLLAGAIT